MSEQTSFMNIKSMQEYVVKYYRYSSFRCTDHEPFIDYDPNLLPIGVRHFTWHNYVEMLKSESCRTHSIAKNKLMIEYFYSKFSKIESADEIGITIDQIPFLIDQNNRLQSIQNIYFSDGTVSHGETDDSFVNKKIFKWLNENKQKEIKQWLQDVGVKERTDLTWLNKTIIPNATTYITSENAIKTIKLLFMLFQKSSIGKKELDQLKRLKLLTTRGTLIPADECYFSDQFKPRLSLEEYLKTKEDIFLSFDYVTSNIGNNDIEDLVEWRRFFSMLGVQEELHVTEFSQKLTATEADQYKFHKRYQSEIYNRFHNVHAFSGLIKIRFLEHTEGKNLCETDIILSSKFSKLIKFVLLIMNSRNIFGLLYLIKSNQKKPCKTQLFTGVKLINQVQLKEHTLLTLIILNGLSVI
jgi:hypothetical protein